MQISSDLMGLSKPTSPANNWKFFWRSTNWAESISNFSEWNDCGEMGAEKKMVEVGSVGKTWRFTTGRGMIKVFCRVDLLLTLLSIFPSSCANTKVIPAKKAFQPKTAPREIGGKFPLEKVLFQNKKPFLVKSFPLEFWSGEENECSTCTRRD